MQVKIYKFFAQEKILATTHKDIYLKKMEMDAVGLQKSLFFLNGHSKTQSLKYESQQRNRFRTYLKSMIQHSFTFIPSLSILGIISSLFL